MCALSHRLSTGMSIACDKFLRLQDNGGLSQTAGLSEYSGGHPDHMIRLGRGGIVKSSLHHKFLTLTTGFMLSYKNRTRGNFVEG